MRSRYSQNRPHLRLEQRSSFRQREPQATNSEHWVHLVMGVEKARKLVASQIQRPNHQGSTVESAGGVFVRRPVLFKRGRLRFVQEQVLRAKKTHSVEAVIHGVLCL